MATHSEERSIQIVNLGINDQLPYAKVDLCKAARVSDNYALSFYQIDYQALAYSVTPGSTIKPEQLKPIPVAKLVMNLDALKLVMRELQQLMNVVEAQEKEHA